MPAKTINFISTKSSEYTNVLAKNCDDALLVYEYLASPLKIRDPFYSIAIKFNEIMSYNYQT